MNTKYKTSVWLINCLIPALLVGCSTVGGNAESTPIDAVDQLPTLISATGIVVPEEWAGLSVELPGIVSEVLVSDSDKVSAGQTLLILQGAEEAKAGITAATLELSDAEHALLDLNDTSAILAANALEIMSSAQSRIIAADRELDKCEETDYLDDVKTAKRDVRRELDQLKEIEKKFSKYADRPVTDDNREYYQERLDDQQRDYDEAVRKLTEIENRKAFAQAQLSSAQAEYEKAELDYQANQFGPDPNELRVVTNRVENARAQLSAAKARMENLVLTAPFDGTVYNLRARVGEYVIPGQPVISIAGNGPLRVETTDLNEIDIARLGLGNSAIISFDAIPDNTITGKVTHIAGKASEGTGVNYTVTLDLEDIPGQLRWGMTAYVDIQVEK